MNPRSGMVTRYVLLPGMHGSEELFSEFMREIPEPKRVEAIHYPADARLSHELLLKLIQSFVPCSDPYFFSPSRSRLLWQFNLPQQIPPTSRA